ncbi:defense protein l(2)34Fc-like [Pelodytes ibericus]
MNIYIENVLLLLIVFSPLHIAAYPNGQVQASCSTMEPNHGTTAQTSSPPYSLSLSNSNFSAGETIKGKLTIKAGGTQFVGFMIQAHDGSSNTPLGSFQVLDGNAQTLTCTNTADAVSHTSSSEKSSVQVNWKAPSSNTTNIQFRATVVQSGRVYWTKVGTSNSGSLFSVPSQYELIFLAITIVNLLFRI